MMSNNVNIKKPTMEEFKSCNLKKIEIIGQGLVAIPGKTFVDQDGKEKPLTVAYDIVKGNGIIIGTYATGKAKRKKFLFMKEKDKDLQTKELCYPWAELTLKDDNGNKRTTFAIAEKVAKKQEFVKLLVTFYWLVNNADMAETNRFRWNTLVTKVEENGKEASLSIVETDKNAEVYAAYMLTGLFGKHMVKGFFEARVKAEMSMLKALKCVQKDAKRDAKQGIISDTAKAEASESKILSEIVAAVNNAVDAIKDDQPAEESKPTETKAEDSKPDDQKPAETTATV